jgi:hypothetical protein
MFKRALAACSFLAGGLITWFVIATLKALGASQAGMSAGPVSGSPGSDAAIPWLFCSYFLVSAVSAIATTKKQTLWVLWAFAHALLAIALCVLASEAASDSKEELVPAILTLALITGVFFSPWLALWGWLLSKAHPVANQ